MATSTMRFDLVPFVHAVPILCVRDVPAGLAYYTEVLGFDQVWAWSDRKESFDEGQATFACVNRGNVSVFLCEEGQGQPGAWISIFLNGLDDLEAVHHELQERGANITQPPTDEPWGMREMHVKDPDGNTLRIGAGLPEGESE